MKCETFYTRKKSKRIPELSNFIIAVPSFLDKKNHGNDHMPQQWAFRSKSCKTPLVGVGVFYFSIFFFNTVGQTTLVEEFT